jgi:hypothetical protein
VAGQERSSPENHIVCILMVLTNVAHPGNIGIATRAMKVMRLCSLHRVTFSNLAGNNFN